MRKVSVMATLVTSPLAPLPGSTISFLSTPWSPAWLAILCRWIRPSDKIAACLELSLMDSIDVM